LPYNHKTKNKMYTVSFFKNRELVNQFTFGTEHKAEQCLLRHASEKQLEVREDNYYASSEGNFPEVEIEIVYSEN